MANEATPVAHHLQIALDKTVAIDLAIVVLITGPDQQIRILRADIEAMKNGAVPVIPAGFDHQFAPQQLADLFAFFKASR
jgi:hypothetical protein